MIPNKIIDKLTVTLAQDIRIRQAFVPDWYGDVFELSDWGGVAYNDQIFFNVYLFGVNQRNSPIYMDRRLRDVEPPKDTGDETALTFLFDDNVTKDYMLNGPGKSARYSSIPLVDRFFGASGNDLPMGTYTIEDLEDRLYKFTGRALHRSWPAKKVPNYFQQDYYDTDPVNARGADLDFMTRSNTHGRQGYVLARGDDFNNDLDIKFVVEEKGNVKKDTLKICHYFRVLMILAIRKRLRIRRCISGGCFHAKVTFHSEKKCVESWDQITIHHCSHSRASSSGSSISNNGTTAVYRRCATVGIMNWLTTS